MASRRVANSLVALSSAAVLGVYTAGFLRTRSAADRFAVQAAERRPAPPAPPTTPAVTSEAEAAPALALPTSPRPAAPVAANPATAPIAKASALPVEAAAPAALPVSEPAAPVVEAKPMAEPAPVAAPAPPPVVAAAQAATGFKDGTYYGWGTSRHGDIQAQVVIEGGRIASATIAQCLTRYSCSWIAALPPQVAKRQSPEIDYVSGATQSTNAFYYGVVEALKLAKAQ